MNLAAVVMRRPRVVRRAAFDIGSGASKMLVADVDSCSGVLVGAPLFEAEKPCAFKVDAQGSVDGSLSPGIQQKGFALVLKLAAKARELGATEACGIATEVFRTSPNGLPFLSELELHTRISLSVLSQADEARLGLATAEALTGGSWDSAGESYVAAWDSGGGSFQVTAREPSANGAIDTVALRTFVGKLGTGPSYERLMAKLRKFACLPSGGFAESVNPVLRGEAEALVTALRAELPEGPAWLRGGHVVGIGAWNCIFATTARAIRVLVTSGDAAARVAATVPGEEGESADSTFTVGEARTALAAVTGRTDAELMDVAGHGTDAEGPHLVVPKVALLVAVATHLGIERVTYRRSTGGCAGLMTLGSFVEL